MQFIIYSDAAARSKSDLKREIEKQTIRPVIAEYIFSKMNIINPLEHSQCMAVLGFRTLLNQPPSLAILVLKFNIFLQMYLKFKIFNTKIRHF